MQVPVAPPAPFAQPGPATPPTSWMVFICGATMLEAVALLLASVFLWYTFPLGMVGSIVLMSAVLGMLSGARTLFWYLVTSHMAVSTLVAFLFFLAFDAWKDGVVSNANGGYGMGQIVGVGGAFFLTAALVLSASVLLVLSLNNVARWYKSSLRPTSLWIARALVCLCLFFNAASIGFGGYRVRSTVEDVSQRPNPAGWGCGEHW